MGINGFAMWYNLVPMPIKTFEGIDEKGRIVMTRLGLRNELSSRDFDIKFWQKLSDEQRMTAMWELVETAHELKGGDLNELRLQRSIESLKRRSR